jgi:hypothetical protein
MPPSSFPLTTANPVPGVNYEGVRLSTRRSAVGESLAQSSNARQALI